MTAPSHDDAPSSTPGLISIVAVVVMIVGKVMGNGFPFAKSATDDTESAPDTATEDEVPADLEGRTELCRDARRSPAGPSPRETPSRPGQYLRTGEVHVEPEGVAAGLAIHEGVTPAVP